jgi:hypothetical protein
LCFDLSQSILNIPTNNGLVESQQRATVAAALAHGATAPRLAMLS